MEIYLLRHGETVLNQKNCYYGITDAELTERGRRQAKTLRFYFKKLLSGGGFDYVVSSPLRRSLETARIVSGRKDGDIIIDGRLQEQNFGIFEGYTYEELARRYPKELDGWNRDFADYRIPGGESFRDVRRRTEDYACSLSWKKGTMLLVSHKGTMGHLTAALLGLPLEGYWNFVFEQGCYSRIDMEDGYAIIRKLNQSIKGDQDGFI